MATELEFQNAHELGDLDATPMSMHHTLGPNATQAAAGNHTHKAADVDLDDYLTHEQGDSEYAPINHEHTDLTGLPVVADTAPTLDQEGNALKPGQLWVDSSVQPVSPQVTSYSWSASSGALAAAATAPVPVPGWAKAVWTSPGNGVALLFLHGRGDSLVATAAANSYCQVYCGVNINGGAVTILDSETVGAQALQGAVGRFIMPVMTMSVITVATGDQIKYFPIAGSTPTSVWSVGYIIMRLLFMPDTANVKLTGAT